MELVSFFLLGGFNDGITFYSTQYLHQPQDEDAPGYAQRENQLYQGILTALFVPFIISIFLALIVHLSLPTIYNWFWTSHDKNIITLLRMLIWGLPLLVLVQQPVAATKAYLDMKWFVLVSQISQPLLSIVIALGFHFYLEFGIESMVYGILLSLLINIPISIYGYTRYFSLTKTYRAFAKFKMDTKMLRFVFPQSLNMMLNMGLVKIDSLMLSAFTTANVVGIYALVSGLTQLIRIAKMAFSEIFAPLVAKYKAQNNREGLIESLHSITRFTSFLSIPLLFIVMIFYPDIILAKGETWDNSLIYPWLLVLGPIMSSFFGLAGNLLLMMGRSKLLLINSIGTASLNILLNYLLIPRWGVLGAALATAISNVSISILQIIEVAKLEKINFHISLYSKTLIGALISLPLVILLNTQWILSLSHYLNQPLLGLKIIGFLFSLLIFLLIVFAWPGNNLERDWVLQKLFRKQA